MGCYANRGNIQAHINLDCYEKLHSFLRLGQLLDVVTPWPFNNSLNLFCSPTHVHFRTKNHFCLALEFLRKNWQILNEIVFLTCELGITRSGRLVSLLRFMLIVQLEPANCAIGRRL